MSARKSGSGTRSRGSKPSVIEQLEGRVLLSTTVMYREGGGTGYIDTPFDDTYMTTWSPDSTYGAATNMYCRNNTDGTISGASLLAVKNLFTLLPAVDGSGRTLRIYDARLHLTNVFGTNPADHISIYRMTNGNWLPNAAGSNENNVSWNKANVTSGTRWASGGAFFSSDYTTTNGVTVNWTSTWGGPVVAGITNIIKDIYSAGTNYGILIRSGDNNADVTEAASSEYANSSYRPYLEINYDYVSYRTLTVNNGTGDGSYVAGTVVNVAATPGSGDAFYVWSGGLGGTFGNVNSSSTTFTMPDSDTTIYANVSPKQVLSQKLVDASISGYTTASTDDVYLNAYGSGQDTNYDGSGLQMRTGFSYSLVGWKDLFTLIPSSQSGNSISISSAKLHLFYSGGSSSDTVYANRVLSNWMTGAAGTNEMDVTYAHRDKSAGLSWAAGNFSASDYTSTNQASVAWVSGPWAQEVVIDITALMGDIYSSGNNYGLVLRTSATATSDSALDSETGNTAQRPYLEMSYTYALPTPMHTLTVNSGTAGSDGKNNAPGFYWEGESVSISPSTAPAGQQFNMWIGDVSMKNGFTTLSEDSLAMAQVEEINLGGTVEVGDKFTVTLNGHSLTVSATGATPAQAAIDIVNAVLASQDSEFLAVIPVNSATATLQLIDKTAGRGFTCTVATTESDGSPADGQTISHWTRSPSHVPAADNITVANTHYLMPAYNASVTATYRDANAPAQAYDWQARWQPFVTNTFGAEKEPLTYTYATQEFGSTNLAWQASGEWVRASETSAVMDFETTLPSNGYVEYGLTTSYGTRVYLPSQYTYLHQAFLTGLTNSTTYHYRFVATDERNNTLTSSDKTLTTSTPSGNVVYLAGGHYTTSVAFTLSQANTTYILQGDVTADYTAFSITNSNITLDLGGHTVIYDNVNYQIPLYNNGYAESFWTFINNGSAGVKAVSKNNLKVFNGKLIQGDGFNDDCQNGYGYNPIHFREGTGNNEVAGIYAEYNGSQMNGIISDGAGSSIHHNVVLDRGAQMVNRQAVVSAISGATNVYNNLVLRARQGGIGSATNGDVHDNEVYIDAVCTNGGGIGAGNYQTNVNIHNNRVFGSGYMMTAIAVTMHGSNITVQHNFVHLQSTSPDYRYMEYTPESTQYAFGVRWGADNVTFQNNVSAGYAQGAARSRTAGAWVYAVENGYPGGDWDLTNVVFQNNTIQTIVQDNVATDEGSVKYNGDANANTVGVIFKNNNLISNAVNVSFGDSYGIGSNGLFYGNTLSKTGSYANYHTINMASASTSTGSKFFDTTLSGGASLSDVAWPASGSPNFYVGWSLLVNTTAGATVKVYDAANPTIPIFTGTADASGHVYITDANSNPILYQYMATRTGQTSYSYNVDSIYNSTDHWAYGVVVDSLNELLTL